MKKIEGYVSKKAVRYWLDNYEYLEANDVPPDAPPSNSGPKSFDGITSNQLNKLMLDQAIENLPKLAKACCKARWVHKLPVKKTVTMLEINQEVYYNRCRLAINLIQKEINGEKAQYVGLLKKILG
ncbi:hypothetical protein [Cytobacillus horneckiae]|uniref:hypothetical protein n=1 Tax=Cytobacillus horneckiae TaxID=549687 RepID=UPI003D9AAD25